MGKTSHAKEIQWILYIDWIVYSENLLKPHTGSAPHFRFQWSSTWMTVWFVAKTIASSFLIQFLLFHLLAVSPWPDAVRDVEWMQWEQAALPCFPISEGNHSVFHLYIWWYLQGFLNKCPVLWLLRLFFFWFNQEWMLVIVQNFFAFILVIV